MTATALTPTAPVTALPRLGSWAQWTRDFALIGALSPAGAILTVDARGEMFGATFLWLCVAAGTVSGAAMGPLLRRSLGGRLGTTPIYKLLALGMMAGFAWGAVVGLVGSLGLTETWSGAPAWLMWVAPALTAGVAGAIQFGWFWLPYTLRRARGRSMAPLVVAVVFVTSLLGWASVFGALALLSVPL